MFILSPYKRNFSGFNYNPLIITTYNCPFTGRLLTNYRLSLLLEI